MEAGRWMVGPIDGLITHTFLEILDIIPLGPVVFLEGNFTMGLVQFLSDLVFKI